MPRLEGLAGPTYSTRSISASVDRCINLVPERREIPGPHPWVLVGAPGLRKIWQIEEGPVRGLFASRGRVFAAGQSKLYELFNNGTTLFLGNIEYGTDNVTFADNGTQIAICSNAMLYILNGQILTQITSISSVAPTYLSQVVFLDGYFIGVEPFTRSIRISGLYKPYEWDALDFKVKETSPDNVVGIIEDHGELWVFGEEHSEVWYNSGNADFPFDRIPNARLELGLGAPQSRAKIDNSIFWLGNDERGNRVVWRATGYSAVRISNHSVEHHLNRFVNGVADAVAWTYQEEGHSYYCIQFPSEPPNSEVTWVYDVSTNMWHERGYWNKIIGQFETHRARCHAFAWNKHIVGDRANGKIYQQSLDFYDDDGDRIRRIRILPHINEEMLMIYYHRLQVDLEVAVGLGVIPTNIYGPDMLGQQYSL